MSSGPDFRSLRFTPDGARAKDPSAMAGILDWVSACPRRAIAAGGLLMEQGQAGGNLWVLITGEVEVLRDEVRVARIADSGAVFGEMSVLLGGPCTASVRALKDSTFAEVGSAEEFLAAQPEASLHVARLLARRLDALNRYLIDVKTQYEGHDHLGMVDDVLDTLMHRHPRAPVR